MTNNDQIKPSDTILLLGATGATGSQVLAQLIAHKQRVKVLVRDSQKLPRHIVENDLVHVTEGDLLEFSDVELQQYVEHCGAVISCLGHKLTCKGIYGNPRRLVSDTAQRIYQAVKANAPATPVKYVLMNSNGCRNSDTDEPISLAQKGVINLIRVLLPPHVDNEEAAEFLHHHVGPNDTSLQWVAVRPSGLTNEDVVSDYSVHPTPTRSAIFSDGKISRINVAHFMSRLLNEKDLWMTWKARMPVLYNAGIQSERAKAA